MLSIDVISVPTDDAVREVENAISHNLIMCNKAKLLNPNSFLLGVPGSGKSFSAKMLIVFLALAPPGTIF